MESAMDRLFNPFQISLAGRSFHAAEKAAGRFFRLRSEEMRQHRYDIGTRAYLQDHEVEDGVFAHLCRYQYNAGEDAAADGHFYRVCLQDNRILDAVERAHSFIRLSPLLLYIAAHELVHMIRFDRGLCPFDAPPQERTREEERVHDITRQMLRPLMDRDLALVSECFDRRYHLDGVLQ